MQFFEVRPPFGDVKNLPDEENAVVGLQFLRIPNPFQVELVERK